MQKFSQERMEMALRGVMRASNSLSNAIEAEDVNFWAQSLRQWSSDLISEMKLKFAPSFED
jgi:hypothetical protein